MPRPEGARRDYTREPLTATREFLLIGNLDGVVDHEGFMCSKALLNAALVGSGDKVYSKSKRAWSGSV